MEAISLKLPEDLLEASRRCAQVLHVSRAAYIRRAIERMNQDTRAQLRAERLTAASKKLRKESMKVNAEFAAIETDPRRLTAARSG
jgi:metal-responsive CopG/Arc/MetJ family transcriptional regulator